MKHRTEPPSEQIMRFFTPELFFRFNASDDEEADRADEDWEAAIRAYRHHLDGLRDQMPSQVKKLAELGLHDAEILACEQPIEPSFLPFPFEAMPFWSGFAILSLRREDAIVSLIYVLWDRVREHPSGGAWPFSKRRTHWLHDEIDVPGTHRGRFLHRVLLSDGTILEIPFLSALIHSIPLKEASEGDASRRIA